MAQRNRTKLIATDLDGTLLRSDLTISDRTRRAFRLAHGAGLTTALVSARPPRAIRDIALHVGLEGLAICSNGAILYDVATDEIIHRRDLAKEVAVAFVRRVKTAHPGVILGAEYGHDVACEPGFPADGAFVAVRDEAIIPAEGLLRRAAVKFVVHHPEHHQDALHEQLAAEFDGEVALTRSGGPFVEVQAVGVSKAAGLQHLCDRLALTADQVTAFGDMPNDVPMLQFAGHGVAVANAHPDVIAVADEVTASNDDDGVAQAIEKILNTL